jgi:hypothetical protein
MSKAIKEKTYALALEYAARIVRDKDEAERMGRALRYDRDEFLTADFCLPGLSWGKAISIATGKADNVATKEDFAALTLAANLIVDYLMLRGEIAQQDERAPKLHAVQTDPKSLGSNRRAYNV